jgi:hypothetical protein
MRASSYSKQNLNPRAPVPRPLVNRDFPLFGRDKPDSAAPPTLCEVRPLLASLGQLFDPDDRQDVFCHDDAHPITPSLQVEKGRLAGEPGAAADQRLDERGRLRRLVVCDLAQLER